MNAIREQLDSLFNTIDPKYTGTLPDKPWISQIQFIESRQQMQAIADGTTDINSMEKNNKAAQELAKEILNEFDSIFAQLPRERLYGCTTVTLTNKESIPYDTRYTVDYIYSDLFHDKQLNSRNAGAVVRSAVVNLVKREIPNDNPNADKLMQFGIDLEIRGLGEAMKNFVKKK